jgi:CheY-like chemotaxis protein
MDSSKGRILIVDDEPINLEILEEHLNDEGYQPVAASSAREAMVILAQGIHEFDVILLDWMMPLMSGYELLCQLKSEPAYKSIPVIMQTAKSDKKDIEAGIAAGAYYYLTKPYSYQDLMPLVESAIKDYRAQQSASQLASLVPIDLQTDQLSFTLRTLEECQEVIAQILAWVPELPDIALGLNELIINAIEHGNLEISYAEKSRLNEEGRWLDEINSRLANPQYKDRIVKVTCLKADGKLCVRIEDQGQGFDWEPYLEINPERAFDSHGRGIAMAKMLSFEEVEYIGCGNQVEVTCLLPAA